MSRFISHFYTHSSPHHNGLSLTHKYTHFYVWLTAWWHPLSSVLCEMSFGETFNQLLSAEHLWARTQMCMYVHPCIPSHTQIHMCIWVWMISRDRWINSSVFNEISLRRTRQGQNCDVSLPRIERQIPSVTFWLSSPYRQTHITNLTQINRISHTNIIFRQPFWRCASKCDPKSPVWNVNVWHSLYQKILLIFSLTKHWGP